MQPIPYFGEALTDTWLYEPKIDGWRMQILRRMDGRVELWGRRLERRPDWTGRLKDIADLCRHAFPAGTLVDCELSSSRGRRFVPSLFAKNPKATPHIYVFDILWINNRPVHELPLVERKQHLKNLGLEKPFIALYGKTVCNLLQHHAQELDHGHEGIVIKQIASPYHIGTEAPIATHLWRKIK
jgi:ATP-dependent DNA ligase